MIPPGFRNKWRKQITIHDYAMGRDELFPKEWELVKDNAEKFLDQLNAFLAEAFPDHAFFIASGWRPESVNKATPGASVKSWHIKAMAIDLDDRDHFLKDNLKPDINPGQAELLRKHGLFMEHRDSCPDWCHFDKGNRPDRPSRIFKP
jgi:hypothetical protein